MRLFSSFARLVNARRRMANALFGRALVLNTMPSYIPLIGLADERWKTSAARDGRIT